MGTDQSGWMLAVEWEKGPGGSGVLTITLIRAFCWISWGQGLVTNEGARVGGGRGTWGCAQGFSCFQVYGYLPVF